MRVIWSNDLDYDDWKRFLEEEYPELTESERVGLMYEINDEYLSDERANLNIPLDQPILVIADLGLWYGRRIAYKEIKNANINDCLYAGRDEELVTWYIDEGGDFCCKASHHDGINHYTYRVYKGDATDFQIERLKRRLCEGVATREDIEKVTRRLGDDIANVYGFSISEQAV